MFGGVSMIAAMWLYGIKDTDVVDDVDTIETIIQIFITLFSKKKNQLIGGACIFNLILLPIGSHSVPVQVGVYISFVIVFHYHFNESILCLPLLYSKFHFS